MYTFHGPIIINIINIIYHYSIFYILYSIFYDMYNLINLLISSVSKIIFSRILLFRAHRPLGSRNKNGIISPAEKLSLSSASNFCSSLSVAICYNCCGHEFNQQSVCWRYSEFYSRRTDLIKGSK